MNKFHVGRRDKQLLIELICEKQTKMIVKDYSAYTNKKYRQLEELKIRIKDW